MRARRKSSGSSSRVRFLGSERGKAHRAWYHTLADYYDHLYDPRRASKAYPFLHAILRRRGPIKEVLDVACGTFALDLPLLRRGYHVAGRDRSPDMLRVARRNLARAGQTADLGQADMRTLRMDRIFDAILCLGTAFNYLETVTDARRALRTFRNHLRAGGILVLDLTNFDAWIRRPANARAETDYRAPDGARIAIFGFNEQNRKRDLHIARMITVVHKGRSVGLSLDEARMRIWTKATLEKELQRAGFRPVEWWGDLRLGFGYRRQTSPRLVAVALRK